MARRTRLTPFARFILVMIIVAPLAYLGASYYNGEDGIQNLKELIGIAEPKATPAESVETTTDIRTTPEVSSDSETTTSEADGAEMGYEELQDQYSELKQENLDLKQKLREKELEIQELKRQIRLLQGSTE